MTQIWFDETATTHAAERLAQSVMAWWQTCDLELGRALQIQLRGDLGAGKTTFSRALLKALGYVGRVKSPTYTLCEPYSVELAGRTLPLYHFDLYRIQSAEEWEEAGFRDYFASPALCLVEWPEKADALLPPTDVVLSIQVAEMAQPSQDDASNQESIRQVAWSAYSEAGKILLENLTF